LNLRGTILISLATSLKKEPAEGSGCYAECIPKMRAARQRHDEAGVHRFSHQVTPVLGHAGWLVCDGTLFLGARNEIPMLLRELAPEARRNGSF
jgi:hypothetical protein